MTTLRISLPDELESFVIAEAQALGFASPADYIRAVLVSLRLRQSHATLEKTLVDRIEGPPAIALSSDVWADLKKRVQSRLENRGFFA